MHILKTPHAIAAIAKHFLPFGHVILSLVLSLWPLHQVHAQSTERLDKAAYPTASAPQAAGFMADLPGVNLWFTDTGGTHDQDVLILLHPNTGSSEVWAVQSLVFAKAGFRVIAFDRRG